jgi:invasion protein IalB
MRLASALLPLVAVGIVFMAVDMAAFSQTKPKSPPATQAPAKGETAPPAENQPPPSGWSSRCVSEGRQSALDCRVEQTVVETKTRQFLLQLAVRVPADTRKPVLTIQMPLGVLLTSGVTVKIDDGKADRYDVQTCDQKGCYAQVPVSSDMLQVMGKGKQMLVTLQNLSKQDLNIPVPLNGFMAAYQKIQ